MILTGETEELEETLSEHHSADSAYRAVNTIDIGYETSQLTIEREIIAVCYEIHTKHINTLCGQNVQLLNVKLAVHIVTTGL
jgi:hypothetical protein